LWEFVKYEDVIAVLERSEFLSSKRKMLLFSEEDARKYPLIEFAFGYWLPFIDPPVHTRIKAATKDLIQPR